MKLIATLTVIIMDVSANFHAGAGAGRRVSRLLPYTRSTVAATIHNFRMSPADDVVIVTERGEWN